MTSSTNLRRKGIVRIVLNVVSLLALGSMGLLVDDKLGAAFFFGMAVLVLGFLIFMPTQKREKRLLHVANIDLTASSPKVSGVVVAVVLLVFLAFLTYVAFKHHI